MSKIVNCWYFSPIFNFCWQSF